MAGIAAWQYVFFIMGVLTVVASIYTIKYPKREISRAGRMKNLDLDTVVEQVNDPLVVRNTRRYGWFGLLMGLVFVLASLPVGSDVRSLLAMVALGLPLAFVIATQSDRDNRAILAIVGFATLVGFLVLWTGSGGGLLALLGAVLGIVAIARFFRDDDGHVARTFNYECLHCERVFESDTANMAKATCPDCGSTRVATAVRE